MNKVVVVRIEIDIEEQDTSRISEIIKRRIDEDIAFFDWVRDITVEIE
jgi:hypothetical protein